MEEEGGGDVCTCSRAVHRGVCERGRRWQCKYMSVAAGSRPKMKNLQLIKWESEDVEHKYHLVNHVSAKWLKLQEQKAIGAITGGDLFHEKLLAPNPGWPDLFISIVYNVAIFQIRDDLGVSEELLIL